jgi:hypothetical protein
MSARSPWVRLRLYVLATGILLQLTACESSVVDNIQTFVTDFFRQALAAYVV